MCGTYHITYKLYVYGFWDLLPIYLGGNDISSSNVGQLGDTKGCTTTVVQFGAKRARQSSQTIRTYCTCSIHCRYLCLGCQCDIFNSGRTVRMFLLIIPRMPQTVLCDAQAKVILYT